MQSVGSFFNQAKNLVLETVGLQASENDAEIVKWNDNIQKLEHILITLKKHFQSYASSVQEMARLSTVVADDVASFYSGSEPRKKSIKKFADATLEMGGACEQIFKDQFGWEVISLFDKWTDEINSLKGKIVSFTEQRTSLTAFETRVHNLQNSKTRAASEIAQAENQLTELQNSLAEARTKTREQVKKLVDNRYSDFDAIFVRLMECQVDYFRVASGLVDEFVPNIENYRKRYPRKSGAVNRPVVSHKESDFPKLSSPVAEDHDEDHGSTINLPEVSKNDESDRKIKSAPQPNIPPSTSVTSPVKPETLPAVSVTNGKAPAPRTEEESDEDDFLGLGGSKKPQQPLKNNQVQNQTDPDFSMFNSTGKNRSDTLSAPHSNHGNGSQSKAPAKNNNQPYDPLDLFNTNPPSKVSNVMSAPTSPYTNKPGRSSVAIDDGFDNLFSSKPAAASVVQDKSNKNPVPGPVSANQSAAALNDFKKNNEEEEKRRDDKDALRDRIQEKIDKWALKNSVVKNLRHLLISLNEIIWPNSGWKTPLMEDLVKPEAVKKCYRLAATLVHPDKTRQMSIEVQLLAERVYATLSTAWSAFQVQENL